MDVTVTTTQFTGSDGEPLAMDVYESPATRRATALIIAGFPGGYNDAPSTRSIARLLAASGVRTVAYSNRDPQHDLDALLSQMDERPIAIWATSGNGPLALSLLMRDAGVRIGCAVLHYAYTFDAAAAAKAYGFVDGCSGKSIDDLRADVPLFLSRAGQDQFAGLNESLDSFVAGAIAGDMPLTFVNHAGAPHAFDIAEDNDLSREIIRQSVDFIAFHLSRAPSAPDSRHRRTR